MLNRLALSTALLASIVSVSCATKRLVTTFDMVQAFQLTAPILTDTKNKALPLVEGDSHRQYLAKLEKASPLPVVFSAPDSEARADMWGANIGQIYIWINSTVPVNTQVATLAHEVGHAYQPSYLVGSEGQYFAEAVSYVYCERIGLRIYEASFLYLKPHFEEVTVFLNKHHKLVDAVVDFLMEAGA